ncbi:DUF397 domain-containing protein [Actinomadura livida]|uniref:DUF397 domain-containing protein n=1 Tax=Actinomadura livida TaxID=79909 RepID=A0A7W7MY53_9ACTN|nr:hypothetical protein [Actinomadura catellatispora]GGT82425.1 hypothetical protein GCM10010208_00900 [Actinomadura livida]
MTKKFGAWRVSSYSEAGGHCVEAGRCTSGTIGVRDSTQQGKGAIIEFTRSEWSVLLNAIRAK